jgi:hypothetical protein
VIINGQIPVAATLQNHMLTYWLYWPGVNGVKTTLVVASLL